MPVQSRMTAPIRMARTEVSPTDPGMIPTNILNTEGRFSRLPAAASASGVAPVNPSTTRSAFFTIPSIHTASPDIHPGYAKNKKARTVRAGFSMFMPVPPKTSLPRITAKAMAMASIHKGVSTGTIRGMSNPVTK